MDLPQPQPVPPGGESVWDYPRPPMAEPTRRRLLVRHRGQTVADTKRGWRVLETSHPPVYYFPPDDVAARLEPNGHTSLCEWKGVAEGLDVILGKERLAGAAWRYPRPLNPYAAIAGWPAFFAWAFEECLVDGVPAQAQEGGFYGGWITPELGGPFKGGPASRLW